MIRKLNLVKKISLKTQKQQEIQPIISIFNNVHNSVVENVYNYGDND